MKLSLPDTSDKTASRAWWISFLLLFATMLNYMDRQTLSNLSARIIQEFALTNEQYGNLEFYFGLAFACGALFFGVLADRVSVRWLYPAVLTAWSGVGFATGLTSTYEQMLACRALLGFFEAGHWPCALAVTHAVLSRSDRTMGNSILQSGASFGAILTPLIIRVLVTEETAGAWRSPFWVIGAIGIAWCVGWLMIVSPSTVIRSRDRNADHANAKSSQGESNPHPLQWVFDLVANPRFWAMVVTVMSINITWQLIRAWLPLFLQKGRGYSEAEALYFNSAYYLATDVGCILAGAVVLRMARRGMGPHRSRTLVFATCAVLTSFTWLAASLPHGWRLLGVLLVVGAGSLGLFPCYYSMTQDIDARHIGKVTGLLGFIGWISSSPLQKLFGRLVDETGSFDSGLAVIGAMPMLGLFAILMLWRKMELPATSTESEPPSGTEAIAALAAEEL